MRIDQKVREANPYSNIEYNTTKKTYMLRRTVNKKVHTLGEYPTLEEAIEARVVHSKKTATETTPDQQTITA
jgi:hypothetical protein